MSANESLANLSSESDSPHQALQGDSMPVTASSHDENGRTCTSNKQGKDTERRDVDMGQQTDANGSMKSDDCCSVETRDKQRLHNGCSRCHPTKHVEGVVYCKTCDLCLCVDHRNVHNSWFDSAHEELEMDVYLGSPQRYHKRYCGEHLAHELCLSCMKCETIACLHCDLTESCPGEEKHSLMSLDKFTDVMKEKYGVLIGNLNVKLSKIVKLRKATRLNLEDLVRRSKDMTVEVDKSVAEQIEAIKAKGAQVRSEIVEYESRRTKQVESFASALTTKQESIEALVANLRRCIEKTHVTDQITDFNKYSSLVDESIAVDLGSCFLVEKFIRPKGFSRELEVAICDAPVGVELLSTYKSNNISGDCEAVTYLGKDKFAAGYEHGLEVIAKSASGGYQGRYTAKVKGDIEAIARHPDALIIALCAEEETMSVKYFTYPELDFVKDVCSYWKSGNSFSHLTVTKKRQIVVTDEANSQLRVFDLNGKPLFVIPLKFSLPAYSSVHSLPDNTLLVTQCCDAGLVTRLHIMDDRAKVMWCCGGLENPTGACSNDSGLILIGSETRKAIFIISPAGVLLGELPLPDLPTAGVWDLSLYQNQLAVAISERVRVYNLKFSSSQ